MKCKCVCKCEDQEKVNTLPHSLPHSLTHSLAHCAHSLLKTTSLRRHAPRGLRFILRLSRRNAQKRYMTSFFCVYTVAMDNLIHYIITCTCTYVHIATRNYINIPLLQLLYPIFYMYIVLHLYNSSRRPLYVYLHVRTIPMSINT